MYIICRFLGLMEEMKKNLRQQEPCSSYRSLASQNVTLVLSQLTLLKPEVKKKFSASLKANFCQYVKKVF